MLFLTLHALLSALVELNLLFPVIFLLNGGKLVPKLASPCGRIFAFFAGDSLLLVCLALDFARPPL